MNAALISPDFNAAPDVAGVFAFSSPALLRSLLLP